MGKILMVYASMTGNTEAIAEIVEAGVTETGLEVEKKDVTEVEGNIIKDYEGIILGAYTWGEGALPDDFIDFYDEMESLDLCGKKFAVFGSGDSSYAHFCGAVDLLEDTIVEKGGQILLEGLKVELFPEGDEEDRCKEFGKRFADMIKNN